MSELARIRWCKTHRLPGNMSTGVRHCLHKNIHSPCVVVEAEVYPADENIPKERIQRAMQELAGLLGDAGSQGLLRQGQTLTIEALHPNKDTITASGPARWGLTVGQVVQLVPGDAGSQGSTNE